MINKFASGTSKICIFTDDMKFGGKNIKLIDSFAEAYLEPVEFLQKTSIVDIECVLNTPLSRMKHRHVKPEFELEFVF